jgi:MFS family permease
MYDVKFDRQVKSQENLLSKEEEFHISDVGKLLTNRSFIFIALLCVTFYAAVFPFLKYAPDFFYHKYGMSRETSGDIASLLPYGTVLFTPLFGWFVDKRGRSASLMIYGSLLLIIVHLLFSLTRFNIYILMVTLGIAFSLVPAAMWPAVAKIVPVSRIGTAYGAMFSLQNLGLFAVPIFAGHILDITNKGITPQMIETGAKLYYTPTVLMFVGFGLLGFIFALLLKWDDKTSGYGLEVPSNKKD